MRSGTALLSPDKHRRPVQVGEFRTVTSLLLQLKPQGIVTFAAALYHTLGSAGPNPCLQRPTTGTRRRFLHGRKWYTIDISMPAFCHTSGF